MEDETLVPIEKYAARQRKSIYSIMQLANKGELEARVEEKAGKKQTYIVMQDDKSSSPETQEDVPKEESERVDYKEAYERLQKELEAMKARLDQNSDG